MANGTIDFFNPSSGISVDASWTFQNGGDIETETTRNAELGSSGDELASALSAKRSSTSFIFLHSGSGQTLVIPAAGTVSNGWHFDSVSISWSRDQMRPKMTVACHRHDNGNNHATGSCRTYASSLAAIPVVAFGVPSSFGAAFALDAHAVVDLRSATYTLECTHVDENGRDGTELAGDNHDGRETLQVELTGSVTADDYVSTWDCTSAGNSPVNTGATASSFTFEHHVAHTTESAGE